MRLRQQQKREYMILYLYTYVQNSYNYPERCFSEHTTVKWLVLDGFGSLAFPQLSLKDWRCWKY